jgi:hypothetical protein
MSVRHHRQNPLESAKIQQNLSETESEGCRTFFFPLKPGFRLMKVYYDNHGT